MINKVILKNFQAHEHLELDLAGLTVLAGPSNSGKSAVLRALAGLIRNDPVAHYVRHGAKNLEVTLVLADGHRVVWRKGKDAPSYEITAPNGDVKKLTKVGANVPVEVIDLLKLSPVVLEDKSKLHVNLREQADTPFLVHSTPPYTAKVFGEITSAGKLFSAANEGNRSIRESKKLIRVREGDLVSVNGHLDSFHDLPRLEETLAKVEELSSSVTTAGGRKTSIETLLASQRSLALDIAQVSAVVDTLKPVRSIDIGAISTLTARKNAIATELAKHTKATDHAERLSVAAAEVAKKITQVDTLVAGASGHETALASLRHNYATYTKAARLLNVSLEGLTSVARFDITSLSENSERLANLRKLTTQYTNVVSGLGASTGEIAELTKTLEAAQAELGAIETCPTCGQEYHFG